jgi:putative transcriptional regulator
MRQKLKQARMKAGMKQRETAIAVGISERTYQRIEAGERNPNVETAISIARVLGAKVEKLFASQATQVALTDGLAQNQATEC